MRHYIYIVVLLLILVQCKKPEKVSKVPEIKFIDLPIKDTVDLLGNPIRRATLIFSLVDGNGDIGLKDDDTFPPYNRGSAYYYNLFIDLYKRVNGQLVPIQLTTPFYFRTKYIEPQGINKVLQCTLKVNLDFNVPLAFDSCECMFYMYDRSLNKSNIERTGLRRIAP
ncbi:MAG: hypothetical protein N2449_03575 [Bacteroidales bacterium]|nr:hypothetical protein [Bacteroidales bacterium]